MPGVERKPAWRSLLSTIHSRRELPGGCRFAARFLGALLKETYRHGLIEMVCQRLHHLQPPRTLFVSVREQHVHIFFALSDFIMFKEITFSPALHVHTACADPYLTVTQNKKKNRMVEGSIKRYLVRVKVIVH